jgi:hypothetical protein
VRRADPTADPQAEALTTGIPDAIAVLPLLTVAVSVAHIDIDGDT